MASVLEQEIVYITQEQFEGMQVEQAVPTEDIYEDEKASLWVVQGDIITPSTNLTISKVLKPGVYKVDVSREYGIFCRKMSSTTDELFLFSESIILPLVEEINLFWDRAELYATNKLVHKRGVLLEGCPGTGKSSIISLLSDEIIKRKGIVFKVSDPRNLSVYIDFLKNSFRSIEPDTPVITIIEALEKYSEEEALLDFLDGKSHIDHHVVIATTNNTQEIPDAFLRPSRIDLRIEIPLPSENTREEYFAKKGIDEKIIKNLVKDTKGMSLADLKEVYTSVFLLDYSIEEAVKKITGTNSKKNYSAKTLGNSRLGI